MRLMSTRTGGEASRSFMSGSRLWPPASTLASAFNASRSTASPTECGAAYLNEAGITQHLPRRAHYTFCPWACQPIAGGTISLMQVLRIHQQGGPEVMQVEELPGPEPGQGQVRVRVAAAGVNFIDIYHRSGQYKVPLPFALGREGAGIVDAVGPGVTGIQSGAP